MTRHIAGTRGIAPLGFPSWALAVLEIRLWHGEGGREGGWFGIKNNLSLAWRGNATLLILFTIIIVFTILSSLEISLSQSLQNIVFKYLAAHLSLDGRLKLSAQHSPTPLSRWRHFQPYGWLQEMAELEDEENSKHFSIKLRRFPQFGKSNVSKIFTYVRINEFCPIFQLSW